MLEIDKETNKKFKRFLRKYKKSYNPQMLSFIKENFGQDEETDVLKQIYAELGILEKTENIYLECLDKIKELYGIEKNILEVGCGAYPILSKYIDEEQKEGTITAYDTYLAPSKIGNIKLYRRNLTTEDDVKKFDLLVGVLPCNATTLIIEKANKNKKDFFIAPCKCTHFSSTYLMFNQATLEDWELYIYNLANNTKPDDRELYEEVLPKTNQKIIYTRKK